MEPVFKRVVIKDRWQRFAARMSPLSWIMPPEPTERFEFISYVLGYRWEATDRELELIQRYNMFGETALRIRDTDAPLTFAELLGAEYVPEVHSSPNELLKIESRVRQAAISWAHFLESTPDA